MKKLSLRNIALALGQLVTLLLAGCTSFNQEWQTASEQTPPTNSIEGRWQGIWLSDTNQHRGALRCVLTQNEDGTWRARFKATYNRTLSFGYTAKLKVEPTTNGFKFTGDANLGWYAGGVYHYTGHADDTNFFSTYRCKYDYGTFQMSRP
jgi:hypothetical protein